MAASSGSASGRPDSAKGSARPATRASRKRRNRLGHVLVVEDEGLLAAALEETLLAHGASSVAVCATTEAALAELHRKRPDALVIDVNLADRTDGWTLAELVVELSPRQPRIVFSTAAPERIPAEIAELGVVLAKPYDPADLIRALAPAEPANLIKRLRGALSPS